MRWANLALFSVGVACSRLPNATPLGGREWSPPEFVPDKVPRAVSEASRRSSVPSGLPPKEAERRPPPSSTSGPPSPRVTSTAGAAHFAYKPFVVGDKVELQTHYLIRASATVPGLPTAQQVEIDSKERIEVRVTEISGGELREAEVEYVDSEGHFNFGGSESNDTSNKGKRYRVNFSGDGPRVSVLSGNDDEDAQKGVIFDLFSVSGYLGLVRSALPANPSSGWQHRLSSSELERVFGKLESIRFDNGSLKLLGADASQPEIWNFQCGLGVHIERDGFATNADLTGTCAVRAAETRPVEISLRGPLRADLGGDDATASALSGSIEVQIKQRYTNVASK